MLSHTLSTDTKRSLYKQIESYLHKILPLIFITKYESDYMNQIFYSFIFSFLNNFTLFLFTERFTWNLHFVKMQIISSYLLKPTIWNRRKQTIPQLKKLWMFYFGLNVKSTTSVYQISQATLTVNNWTLNLPKWKIILKINFYLMQNSKQIKF